MKRTGPSPSSGYTAQSVDRSTYAGNGMEKGKIQLPVIFPSYFLLEDWEGSRARLRGSPNLRSQRVYVCSRKVVGL